jgi:hypothetical protein
MRFVGRLFLAKTAPIEIKMTAAKSSALDSERIVTGKCTRLDMRFFDCNESKRHRDSGGAIEKFLSQARFPR